MSKTGVLCKKKDLNQMFSFYFLPFFWSLLFSIVVLRSFPLRERKEKKKRMLNNNSQSYFSLV